MISEFKGEYRWLSNFAWHSLTPITLDYLDYPTVEHAYQASKTLDLQERRVIQQQITAGKAKRLGRDLTIRADWDKNKIKVMRELLEQKFNSEPFRTLLIATGKEHIQEGNNWDDTFWGVDLRTGKGGNQLGKLIMEIRSTLIF